jgi:hypothetical protein
MLMMLCSSFSGSNTRGVTEVIEMHAGKECWMLLDKHTCDLGIIHKSVSSLAQHESVWF